jgi:hypothetical protein
MRTYELYCEADGSREIVTAPHLAAAVEKLRAWLAGGEWGDDGAVVGGHVTRMVRGERTDETEEVEVHIQPNHAALMRDAGAPDCDHDWSAGGEWGCRENPGVWSFGGTMEFRSHCRHCGLRREEQVTGSQSNPGEHDTVRYNMPGAEELAAMREAGMLDE